MPFARYIHFQASSWLTDMVKHYSEEILMKAMAEKFLRDSFAMGLSE